MHTMVKQVRRKIRRTKTFEKWLWRKIKTNEMLGVCVCWRILTMHPQFERSVCWCQWKVHRVRYRNQYVTRLNWFCCWNMLDGDPQPNGQRATEYVVALFTPASHCWNAFEKKNWLVAAERRVLNTIQLYMLLHRLWFAAVFLHRNNIH